MPMLPKRVGLSWIGILFAPLILGFLMAGCIVFPISGPSESPSFGKRVEQQEVELAAAVGKSREEVISNLGKPTIELKDLGILVYPWIENKGELLFAFGAPGAAFATTMPWTEPWALLVAFSDKNLVTHAGVVREREKIFSRESINTTARNWTEAQGIELPPLQTTFILSSAPVDKSLVYVFRTKPPATLLTMLGAGYSFPLPVAIAVDGQYISEMHNETYIEFTVEPGKHELLSDAVPSYRYFEGGGFGLPPDKRRPASVTLNTMPNQVYFVELLCTTGTGKIESSFVQKTEAEAS